MGGGGEGGVVLAIVGDVFLGRTSQTKPVDVADDEEVDRW